MSDLLTGGEGPSAGSGSSQPLPPLYDCSAILLLLYPHLDGELDASESLRVHEHLDLCCSCRDTYIAERWMHTVTGPSLMPERAPESLRRLVLSTVSDEVIRAKRRWLFRPRVFIVAAAIAVIAAIACLATFSRPSGVADLVGAAVVEHGRYLENARALPIRGRAGATVVKQLEQEVPFRLGLPADTPSGVELDGASVLSLGTTKAAYLMYRVRGVPVSLLLSTPQEVVVPVAEIVTFKNIIFHPGNVDGYHTLQWSDRHLTYVLVSEQRQAAYDACIICHGSPQGRETIAGFFRDI